MTKNLRQLFLNEPQYQKELIYFLMLWDSYFNEVRELHLKDDTIKKWETLTPKEQKKWILDVFIPSLDKEYIKKHLNKAYFMLHLKKEGRFFKNYYKENEPEQL